MNNNKLWNSYNELFLSSDTQRISKIISRYELFKKTINIPGDIVECGVFKGVSFLFWVKCLKIFSPNSSKKVIGFDMFSSFPKKTLNDHEKISAEKYVKSSNFRGSDIKKIKDTAYTILGNNNYSLIKGDITKTAKKYVKKNYGFKISLLHLDLDTYSGTKAALENFFPYLSKGGIVILDEYASRGWGETSAVDEYFEKKNYKINSISFTHSPTAYIKK
tara:strand:+ start:23 stop:679 length:657 start_codon:yes stop_codon:yes gene_type:complete